jgi:hypothetical protein
MKHRPIEVLRRQRSNTCSYPNTMYSACPDTGPMRRDQVIGHNLGPNVSLHRFQKLEALFLTCYRADGANNSQIGRVFRSRDCNVYVWGAP